MKAKIAKAALYGISAGIIISSAAIIGISAKTCADGYFFKQWVEKSQKENPARISRDYLELRSGGHVPMFESTKAKRSEALFTWGTGSCCVLGLDSKTEGTHYLGHFSAADEWKEIRDSITKNFTNTRNLEAFFISGEISDSRAAMNVYKALRSLNLLEKTKYCQSDKILIEEGKLYYPVY